MEMKKQQPKKLGRPVRISGEPRHNRLDLRVTDKELAGLKAEAKRRGVSLTELLLAPFRKEQ
jgi:hypothetical protein